MLADLALINLVGVREREHRLAPIHPGYAPPAINTRLDAFVYGDQIKFVEYSAENPSSLPDQTELNQVLFEVRALQSFAERYRIMSYKNQFNCKPKSSRSSTSANGLSGECSLTPTRSSSAAWLRAR